MDHLLNTFNVKNPIHKVKTGIADVWQVDLPGGGHGALKIYNDGNMQDELPGFELLQAMDGQAVARVMQIGHGAVLSEWLEGPTLADISRGGDDLTAGMKLAKAARAFHGVASRLSLNLPLWEDWLEPLFTAEFAPTCDPTLKKHVLRTQQIAKDLLSTQALIGPLHGDFHHDNVKETDRGLLAFDAKGLIGDRAYDLAQALFNPLDMHATVYDPTRIDTMLSLWSDALDVTRDRILGWAIVKLALTEVWRADGPITTTKNVRLLALLIGMQDQEKH